MKVLVWANCFEAIAQGQIPAPVSVTIDPSNACNLNCTFCQYAEWRKTERTVVPKQYLLELPSFLARWGVKSACVAGGGEEFTNPVTPELIEALHSKGVQAGVITNGTLIQDCISTLAKCCRWVGFSMDAGTAETYSLLKQCKQPMFDQVCADIAKLAKQRPRPSIGFKFLLQPENIAEIYTAAKLAKSLGCDDFHARPVYLENLYWEAEQIETVLRLVERARGDLEDSSFHIYGITHKFNPNFRKKSMKKCQVTPIAGLTFCADGWASVCCDLRGVGWGRLCRWYPENELPKVWGSDRHKRLVEAIDPAKCPHRCTYQPYQEVLESVFIKDRMTRFFP